MPAPLRQGIGVVECEGLDRAELPEFNDSDPSDAVSLGVTVGVRSADGPAVRERETYASTASRSAGDAGNAVAGDALAGEATTGDPLGGDALARRSA